MEPQRALYDLAFQVSPIILEGGIAEGSLGGRLPIIALVGQLTALTQATATGNFSFDEFFARFTPIPGSSLINNAIGSYPFANQKVAANAVIDQPTSVSLLMISPVKETGGYLTKLAILTALQNSLKTHNSSGGTYTIATPAYIYTNCVMTSMTDVTSGETKQQQVQWQLDFVKPLITTTDAIQAAQSYNAYMQKLIGGNQLDSNLTGPKVSTGTQTQGSIQGVAGMAASVNKFLSAPL